MNRGWTPFNVTSVVMGFSFLYIPILILIIYSFNASKLVTVWAGFSTQWYARAFANEGLVNAALVTLRVGLISATVATVLGTLAALALVRFSRFRGRFLFSGMIYAPLVMPEVITGLSLLLLFVSVGMDRGGDHRHSLPHHVFHVFCRRCCSVPAGQLRPVAGRSST